MTPLPVRVEEVASIAQVEALRVIRNMTTGSFSYFNGLINYDQQQVWWEATRKTGLRAWLYYQPKPVFQEEYLSFDLVGYGMVRKNPETLRWWNSIAVLPDWQGCGYGTFITTNVMMRWPTRIYAAVRKDNPAGLHMHKPEFWTELREEELPYDLNEPERLVYFESKLVAQ